MEKRELMLAVFFITIVLILLFLLIRHCYKRNQQQQKLSQAYDQALLTAQIEVQEHTLSSVGSVLHDNIGQLLSSTKMMLGIMQRTLKDAPDILNTAEETMGKAITEVRSLSKLLNKEWLKQFNLIENLHREVQRINAAQDLQIQFTHCENISLTPNEQLILFSIIQEALQNAIKHSGAENIQIDIPNYNDDLVIKIIDNGKGLEKETNASGGLGLKNMKHRTTLLGGNIEWANGVNKGVTVTINLPYKKNLI